MKKPSVMTKLLAATSVTIVYLSLSTTVANASITSWFKSTFQSEAESKAGADAKKLAPENVSIEQRTVLMEQLESRRQKFLELERIVIEPSAEDFKRYADFLQQPNTGLTRLFPHGEDKKVRPFKVHGDGSYFQFKNRSHEYGYGSDIKYYIAGERPYFQVGFAGVDYGFFSFAAFNRTGVRSIDVNNPTVQIALNVPSMNGRPEPEWREMQKRFSNRNQELTDIVHAYGRQTYVLRSVSEGGYDVVVAFEIVRRDPIDGSIIIAWKLLADLGKPVLAR